MRVNVPDAGTAHALPDRDIDVLTGVVAAQVTNSQVCTTASAYLD